MNKQIIPSAESKSADLIAQNLEHLKQIFPEVIKEGKVDFEALHDLLGNYTDTPEERFALNWAGKANARREAQKRSTGTLRPCPEESVDWDKTENLYIEGDNLEVLKLLQKSYHNRVKMIYIDPPYNTGKDFVYKDNYKDNMQNYLELTGQDKKLSTNTESDGRYHSNWLNMMYPRLKLARNLLTDEGVIFISINENEVANLRKICDEIFGEENFVTELIWNKQHSQQQGLFKMYHETILVYAKNVKIQKNIMGGEGIIEAGALKKVSRSNPKSEFLFPAGVRFDAPEGTIIEKTFGDSEKVEVVNGRLICENGKTKEEVTLAAGWTQKDQMSKYFKGEEVIDSKGQKVLEFYFSSTGKLKSLKERSKITPSSLLPEYGMVSEQTAKLRTILGGNYFDNPKPINMIKDFVGWFSDSNSIILDFFSGSATTAHAVMQLNAEDGGNRKYICVQIPEPTPEDSEARKAGYNTIPEIAKERIRRAGKKIVEEQKEKAEKEGDLFAEEPKKLDIGFKVFKLDSSNINAWDSNPENLETALQNSLFNIKDDRSEDDLLYEILIKYGIELTEKINRHSIDGKTVYEMGAGSLIVCLADNLTTDVAEGIGKLFEEVSPEGVDISCRVVFKDSGFNGSDEVKTNTMLILKQHGIFNVTSV